MKKVIILIIALAIIITGFWIIFLQFEPTKKEAKEPAVTANKTTKKRTKTCFRNSNPYSVCSWVFWNN